MEAELLIPVMGWHEARDAALVVAAGQALGASMADPAEGLADFEGIVRSVTVAGRPNGITIVDSIAVHPAEPAYDLAAARQLTGHLGRVIALYEPTGRPATIAHGRELGRRLAVADDVVLLPVFDPAGNAHPGFGAGTIARTAAHHGLTADRLRVLHGPRSVLSPDLEQHVATLASPGDVIAVIGTGHTTHLAQRLWGRPAPFPPADNPTALHGSADDAHRRSTSAGADRRADPVPAPTHGPQLHEAGLRPPRPAEAQGRLGEAGRAARPTKIITGVRSWERLPWKRVRALLHFRETRP
ncbi:hypothetical protein [Streptomyces sp. NPDC020362]|uniref:glutamate ligase domain-containing protein n=1 Tax=Streptomyces sp. NPDC020362 TaxID=3154486 RepID=UPI0033FD89B3